jgi:mycoredoxin
MPDLVPLPAPEILTVYGGDWCGDCRRSRRLLDDMGVPYRYVDLGRDDAARQALDDAGYRAIPIVATVTGLVLVEPSDDELAAAVGASR